VPIVLLPPNILHILEDIFKSGLRPNLRLCNLSGLTRSRLQHCIHTHSM